MRKTKDIIVIKSETDKETGIEFPNRTQEKEEHNTQQNFPSKFSTQ
jgi:hypothetical protein